jgi:hypothetical protein
VALWKSARTRGKQPGDRVLFLQLDARAAHWVGWGTVIDCEERWKVFGVRVRCDGLAHPPVPVIAPEERHRLAGGGAAGGPSHVWEYRELGRELGLDDHRERTPYLDTHARDLRVGPNDLAFLVRLQPQLAKFGVPPPTV